MTEYTGNAWHHMGGVTSEELQRAAEETELRYGDIINLPHFEPKNHPRMPAGNRAAQFSPFAALTGYGDAIDEATRLHVDRNS